MVDRKEPQPPASAIRLFYEDSHIQRNWCDVVQTFNDMPPEDRRDWEEKSAADRRRFEQDKREYNYNLDLEEDITTDNEGIGECECGTGLFEIREETLRRRCEQIWGRYRRNHHKFNASYEAPRQAVGPGCFHRFMDLPEELRSQIYTYLLYSAWGTGGLRQWQLEFESNDRVPEFRFTDNLPLDTRILVTNHEVYRAALNTLYSTNCFTVDVSRASTIPLFIQGATNLSPPRPTSRIRRWHIRLVFTDIIFTNTIVPQLVAVRDVMKQCVRLDEVRFTWITVPDYWERELHGLVREYDAMLQIFREVQGVGEVIFTEANSQEGHEEEHRWVNGYSTLHQASKDVKEAVKASMESPIG
ncbi:MAG: hypothetical protein L6R39_003067 [Caloplaca ligustica]|nr:MAG: hypothetical protein L6R39_003067 [Caloplaca ligustica]